jgi:hypothetical protein
MSNAVQYEFTEQQNSQFRNLAGKMSFVGFFSAAFGVIALLTCILTIAFIFQDRLPAGFRERAGEYMQKAQASLPEDLKKQASQHSLDQIPTGHNFLSGLAIFTGITGLIFLLQGIWTRSSAASFQKIVHTRGNDIDHLMNAMGSLAAMYGQIYRLLLTGLLGGLIAIGLTVYHYFGH